MFQTSPPFTVFSVSVSASSRNPSLLSSWLIIIWGTVLANYFIIRDFSSSSSSLSPGKDDNLCLNFKEDRGRRGLTFLVFHEMSSAPIKDITMMMTEECWRRCLHHLFHDKDLDVDTWLSVCIWFTVYSLLPTDEGPFDFALSLNQTSVDGIISIDVFKYNIISSFQFKSLSRQQQQQSAK